MTFSLAPARFAARRFFRMNFIYCVLRREGPANRLNVLTRQQNGPLSANCKHRMMMRPRGLKCANVTKFKIYKSINRFK